MKISRQRLRKARETSPKLLPTKPHNVDPSHESQFQNPFAANIRKSQWRIRSWERTVEGAPPVVMVKKTLKSGCGLVAECHESNPKLNYIESFGFEPILTPPETKQHCEMRTQLSFPLRPIILMAGSSNLAACRTSRSSPDSVSLKRQPKTACCIWITGWNLLRSWQKKTIRFQQGVQAVQNRRGCLHTWASLDGTWWYYNIMYRTISISVIDRFHIVSQRKKDIAAALHRYQMKCWTRCL